MEENVKNLCAPIPAGLHARVREEQEGRLPEEAVAETEGETDGCDEDTEESSTEG